MTDERRLVAMLILAVMSILELLALKGFSLGLKVCLELLIDCCESAAVKQDEKK